MNKFKEKWGGENSVSIDDCMTAFSFMHWKLPKLDSRFIKSSKVISMESNLTSCSLSSTFPDDQRCAFTARFLEITGLPNSKSLSQWVATNIRARTPKFGSMHYWITDPNGKMEYFCKYNNILPITLASVEVENQLNCASDMIEFEVEFYCSSLTHTEKDKRVCEKQMAKFKKQYPNDYKT